MLGLAAACTSPEAPATACPEAPGTFSTIALGTLVGADATRLFFRPPMSTGLMAWSKRDGVATLFRAEDLGTRLTVSRGDYYWIAPGEHAINVTDAGGAILRTVPLASIVSSAKQLVVAPDGGVYVLTHCLDPLCPPSPPDTIERLSNGATASQTIVTSPTPIAAIASTGAALFWAENSQQDEPVRIMRRDAITGEVTTLVDGVELRGDAGSLLISGDELFDVARVESPPFGYSDAIERRNLADGALLASYHPYAGLTPPAPPPQWLVLDGDLYWTQGAGMISGPPQNCSFPLGLARLRLSEPAGASLDGAALPSPLISDEDILYYASAHEPNSCCEGNGQLCSAPLLRPEIRCYRKP